MAALRLCFNPFGYVNSSRTHQGNLSRTHFSYGVCRTRSDRHRATLLNVSSPSDTPQEHIDNLAVIDVLEEYVRSLAGEHADYVRGSFYDGRIRTLFVQPKNPKARGISVIGEQSLIVEIGNVGGRWELDYTVADVDLVRKLIDAAVAGRVTEVTAPARSKVTVTFPDGSTDSETGYDGCLTILIPLPGWTKLGRKIVYEPYRPAPEQKISSVS